MAMRGGVSASLISGAFLFFSPIIGLLPGLSHPSRTGSRIGRGWLFLSRSYSALECIAVCRCDVQRPINDQMILWLLFFLSRIQKHLRFSLIRFPSLLAFWACELYLHHTRNTYFLFYEDLHLVPAWNISRSMDLCEIT